VAGETEVWWICNHILGVGGRLNPSMDASPLSRWGRSGPVEEVAGVLVPDLPRSAEGWPTGRWRSIQRGDLPGGTRAVLRGWSSGYDPEKPEQVRQARRRS